MCAAFADLVPGPQPRVLADGFRFTEGPLWHPDGYLVFSDIPASAIYRLEPNGSVYRWLHPSANANGLTFDRQGRLLACEHGGRRVSRMGPGRLLENVADRYDGKRLNSPNDIVCHSSGRIYFTDPPYGIDPDPGEQGCNGVYRVDPDGSVHRLFDDFGRPNGLAFSPDERLLYVNDTVRRHIRISDVHADGSVANDRVFVDMDEPPPGSPDGMKVDVEGNVYCTGSGGIWVIDPQGNHLGTIACPHQPTNIAFGGPDMTTLYITARPVVCSIQVKVPGMRVL